MKVTLKDLFIAKDVIGLIAEEKPQSAKLAYRLSRVVASARSELELLAKTQGELLQKYGVCVDETTGQWVVREDCQEEFGAQWIPLLETEVEVWGNPIKVNDINGDLGSLTVDQYSKISWLFTDEE